MSKILLVDKDLVVSQAVVQFFQADSVTSVADIESALFELDQFFYDIVLMDLNASGWELLRIVKDRDNGWALPVILTTVAHEPECALKAWNLGADYFVTKPYGLRQITRVIERALAPTIDQELI